MDAVARTEPLLAPSAVIYVLANLFVHRVLVLAPTVNPGTPCCDLVKANYTAPTAARVTASIAAQLETQR